MGKLFKITIYKGALIVEVMTVIFTSPMNHMQPHMKDLVNLFY